MHVYRAEQRDFGRRLLQRSGVDLVRVAHEVIDDRRDRDVAQAQRHALGFAGRQRRALREEQHAVLIAVDDAADCADALPLRDVIAFLLTEPRE